MIHPGLFLGFKSLRIPLLPGFFYITLERIKPVILILGLINWYNLRGGETRVLEMNIRESLEI